MPDSSTQPSYGFTILEVMIVLAISGVMFLIAVQFINGKLARASFTTGVNDLASQLRGLIEEVSDGAYNDIPLTCSVSGSNPNFTVTAASGGSAPQGTNSSCVFLGKLIHFYGTPANSYEVISLAAARAANDPSHANGITGLTSQTQVPQSLEVSKVYVNGSSTSSLNVGVIQSQGNAGGSGAQTISLTYDSTAMASALDGSEAGLTGKLTAAPVTSASICVTDGSRNALVLIGLDSASNATSPLSVSVHELETTPCP